MFWLDDSGTDTLKGRDSADSAWLSLGLWEANFGMLRRDGSNAMTGALDLDGQDLVLDSDADSFLHASADDTIDLVIGPTAAQTYRFTATAVDINASELILDADADTSITADTDDRIDLRVGAVDVAHVAATGLKLGTTSNHGTTAGTNAITMLEGTAPAGTITNGGSLYVADVSGTTQLFFIRSDGTTTQLS